MHFDFDLVPSFSVDPRCLLHCITRLPIALNDTKTNRNIKRLVYCRYRKQSLTFRAVALCQRETWNNYYTILISKLLSITHGNEIRYRAWHVFALMAVKKRISLSYFSFLWKLMLRILKTIRLLFVRRIKNYYLKSFLK